MKKYLSIIVVIIAFQFAACSQTPQSTVVKTVSCEEFKTNLAKDKNAVIIDLRTTEEMDKGYIKGAIQINYLASDANERIDKLDKSKTYYIYCAGGKRSARAADYMEKHDFKHVCNLEKGFSEWVTEEFPVEKK
jgi:rhodanese-related sulfurtransferase